MKKYEVSLTMGTIIHMIRVAVAIVAASGLAECLASTPITII